MADIFLSYAREDRDVVRRLAEAVAREGYDVWWDDQIPAHAAYGDIITEKIGGAKAAIVIWSAHSAASEWVRAEADVARQQRKLIQTSLGEVTPPLPFNMLQCADIGDWTGEAGHPGWEKVKQSLVYFCGPPRSAAPPPEADPVPVAIPPTPPQEPAAAPPPLPSPPSAPAEPLSVIPAEAASVGRNRTALWVGGGIGAVLLLALVLMALSNRPAPDAQAVFADGGASPATQSNPPSLSGAGQEDIEAAVSELLTTLQSGQPASSANASPVTDGRMNGNWNVSWTFLGVRHSGLLSVNGSEARMDIRFGSGRVTQDCTLGDSSGETEIRCRNVRLVEGSGIYAPDAMAVRVTGASQLTGRMLDVPGGLQVPVSFNR